MSYQSNNRGNGGDPNPLESAMMTALMFIAVGVTAGVCVFLAPGILMDWAFDRLSNRPEGTLGLFGSAMKDGLTWVVSIVFWAALGVTIFSIYRRRTLLRRAQAEPAQAPFDRNSTGYTGGYSNQTGDATFADGEQPADADEDDFKKLCTDEACAEALGLSGDLTMEDIRGAYRRRIAEYHPDKVAHLGPKLREVAELESKRLNVAYQYFEEHYGQVA